MKIARDRSIRRIVCLALLTTVSALPAPSLAGEQEGILLYETYCISCHTTQIHWREKRLAKDWITLKGQVDRWQLTIGQSWSRQQIDDVTRYLNGQFYKFDPAAPSQTKRRPDEPVITTGLF
jgi:mono/diheme cytochrome c family protein